MSSYQHVQVEELKKAILVALDEKLPGRRGPGRSRDELRAAAEAIQYEDWAVDYDMVRCLCFTFQLSISSEVDFPETCIFQEF